MCQIHPIIGVAGASSCRNAMCTYLKSSPDFRYLSYFLLLTENYYGATDPSEFPKSPCQGALGLDTRQQDDG